MRQNLDVSPGWWLNRLGASAPMAPQHPAQGDLFTARFLWEGPCQERGVPRVKNLAASCSRPTSSSPAGLSLGLHFRPVSSAGLASDQQPFNKDHRPRRAGRGSTHRGGVLPTAGSANSLHLGAPYKQRQHPNPHPGVQTGGSQAVHEKRSLTPSPAAARPARPPTIYGYEPRGV